MDANSELIPAACCLEGLVGNRKKDKGSKRGRWGGGVDGCGGRRGRGGQLAGGGAGRGGRARRRSGPRALTSAYSKA